MHFTYSLKERKAKATNMKLNSYLLTRLATALCVSLTTGAPILAIDLKNDEVQRETATLSHRIFSLYTGRYVQITKNGKVNANALEGKYRTS